MRLRVCATPVGSTRFINPEILALAMGAGLAVAAIKGGNDHYIPKNMINQEREARTKTEQELRELIVDLRTELREERHRFAAQPNQTLAIQQAMLDSIVRLAERRNGNSNATRASE